MNWYKKSFNMTNQVSSAIASILVNLFYGTEQSSLEDASNIVSSLPDENSLQDAINKGINMALKLTRQEMLNPEQTEVVQTMQSSFYAQKTQKKIEPDQPMMNEMGTVEPMQEGMTEPAMGEVAPSS